MFISDYRKEIVTTNILALSSFLSVQKASSTFNYAPHGEGSSLSSAKLNWITDKIDRAHY